MTAHEQFADDLALYALDALTGEDRAKLEQHLATCPACKLELEQLRGDGALLALSTMGPKPPVRARQRLLDAVAKETPTSRAQNAREMGHPGSIAPRRSWWGWLGWAATAAVIVLAASLWKENAQLHLSLTLAKERVIENTRQLAELQRVDRKSVV